MVGQNSGLWWYAGDLRNPGKKSDRVRSGGLGAHNSLPWRLLDRWLPISKSSLLHLQDIKVPKNSFLRAKGWLHRRCDFKKAHSTCRELVGFSPETSIAHAAGRHASIPTCLDHVWWDPSNFTVEYSWKQFPRTLRKPFSPFWTNQVESSNAFKKIGAASPGGKCSHSQGLWEWLMEHASL